MIGLDVNADKTTYLVISRDQNAGRIHSGIVQCLGTNLKNQNYIEEEIKTKLKSSNAYCLSVQSLFFFSLLSKNIRIKIYRTIILPVVLYGCESWSLPLKEEIRQWTFENRVLWRIFGPKREEVTWK
jgi:hypothetical protein